MLILTTKTTTSIVFDHFHSQITLAISSKAAASGEVLSSVRSLASLEIRTLEIHYGNGNMNSKFVGKNQKVWGGGQHFSYNEKVEG